MKILELAATLFCCGYNWQRPNILGFHKCSAASLSYMERIYFNMSSNWFHAISVLLAVPAVALVIFFWHPSCHSHCGLVSSLPITALVPFSLPPLDLLTSLSLTCTFNMSRNAVCCRVVAVHTQHGSWRKKRRLCHGAPSRTPKNVLSALSPSAAAAAASSLWSASFEERFRSALAVNHLPLFLPHTHSWVSFSLDRLRALCIVWHPQSPPPPTPYPLQQCYTVFIMRTTWMQNSVTAVTVLHDRCPACSN